MYNGSYFYFSFFVCRLRKKKRILRYPFPIFYHEIEKRKTKGRYIHGPHRTSDAWSPLSELEDGVVNIKSVMCETIRIANPMQKKAVWYGWLEFERLPPHAKSKHYTLHSFSQFSISFFRKKMANLIKSTIYIIIKHFREITSHTDIPVQKYL